MRRDELIEPAWIALVEMLARIEEEPYHWPIGRTSFQKLAYFATEDGLPTGLTFKKGSYGPFSVQLKAHITRLVNNGLINEERKDHMLVVSVGPTYWEDRHNFDPYILQWETLINKVADLFVRLRTHQAEIAATVHFAAHHLVKMDETSEDDVLQAVRDWKVQRRPPLSAEEVASTIRNLNMLGWIDAQYSPDLLIESFVEV